MKMDEEFEKLIRDAEKPFSGWDFSFITETGRMQSGMLSWSYGSIVVPFIREAKAVLDMGTGGGELLSKLQPFPEMICATEGYEPNVPVAKKRLEPLGVQVVQIGADNLLPFHDGQFDLVMNKHEEYSPSEVRRVLSKRGNFITQQVGGNDCTEINQMLGAPANDEFAHWNLQYAKEELIAIGFEILEAREEFPYQRYYDVGALVYYLNAIPWQVPGFTVEKYREELYHIHKKIQSEGYWDVRQNRFLIRAKIE